MKTSQSTICLIVAACLLLSLSLLVMTPTEEKIQLTQQAEKKITTKTDDVNYGRVIGKFVFKGNIPATRVLVRKGDPNAKDAHVSALHGVHDESLVIDPINRGIQNIVVYIKKFDKEKIHPSIANSPKQVVRFRMEGTRYQPHVLFIRTDQSIEIESKDACNHNFHSFSLRGKSDNFLIHPMSPLGVVVLNMETPESLPIAIQCDIHPWMKAHWMILDHPYCAITKADGSFEIPLLPKGKYDFRVWHEKKGYISVTRRTGFIADVGDRTTSDVGTIELKIKDFRQ